MFTPMIGNIAAIGILVIGCAVVFWIEWVTDRRRMTRYLPRPTHRGATKRVITARKCP